jgi:ketosteroid isomerase-like protein
VTSVREAIERGDVESFGELLDPGVVWVGVLPGQLCRNRDDVLAMFRRATENGLRASPEILVEAEGALVVDPHLDPPAELNPHLHQVIVVHDDRVVEVRDYPDRASALAAVRAS